MPGFVVFVLAAVTARGASTNQVMVAHVHEAFTRAQKEYAAHPDNDTNVWQLGQESYNWGELTTNAGQRAIVAQAGIEACEALLAREPNSALGHYYLAMDYGELASAEAPSIAAYKLIREIEREFKAADDLDERLDFAGPVRCLGLLYRDAPGWPISIGSKRKAREYLERAAILSPDFPENQMNLVESYVRWHEAVEAEKAWEKLMTIWPSAQKSLAGVAWEQDWDDWNHRRDAVKADFQKNFKYSLDP